MNHSATGLVRLLQKHELRVFTTFDVITLTGMASATVTQSLRRLAARELIVRIKRGVWVSRLATDLNPYEAVPHLRAPWPAYVSLHSALADYGIVDEVPQVVYAVSAALPKRYRTFLGEFHIHHLPEHLMWGYEIRKMGRGGYPVAEPEKAFLDLVYLALTPRSPLELPHKRGRSWKLNGEKLRKYARRFGFQPLTEYMKRSGLW